MEDQLPVVGTFDKAYGRTITLMYILALNPHADAGAVLAYSHANMGAVFVKYGDVYEDDDDDDDDDDEASGDDDDEGDRLARKTALEYLLEYNFDTFKSIMVAL
eukprot:CAMPEP_0204623898 /NCGR_PEP_ID=MMETSP0717-20131115/9657_1 /ASSEMBLY_ACC=CAM_ASM_000666 /TAXON_ID=230516 /ORGANISM="Chaetoceros curvisetus" /LENGTH=103 /DNA_ID=CAMNT_0051639121 /DNA_START=612 /DNA_END=923 /DNA_ORIENTATION=+